MPANKRHMVIRVDLENDPEDPGSPFPVVTHLELTMPDGAIKVLNLSADSDDVNFERSGVFYILHAEEAWGMGLSLDHF